ncbi:TPA: hypothetical protein ACG1JD_004698, partial [Citrobacter sedlakii]
ATVTTMLHQHGDQSAGVGLVMGFMKRFMYRASFATEKKCYDLLRSVRAEFPQTVLLFRASI